MRMSYTAPAHLKMKEIIFETHAELDEYFDIILERIPQFRDRYPHDCALLKAYGNHTTPHHITPHHSTSPHNT